MVYTSVVIKLENVWYRYRGAKDWVIQDLTLEIQDGEFIVLKGNNGSGKSTLARLITGITKPKRGTVTVNDINTRDRKSFYDLRKNISIVFQNPENNLLFDKVYSDIAFGLENLKFPKHEHKERIENALERVGMSGYENHSTYELSFGQKQRIAIAGVLAMDCKVLVVDEPTAMLDSEGKESIYNLLWELNSQGVTIILATNIEAETKKGRIIEVGGAT